MKNYYDQKHELDIAKSRLKSLHEKRDLYFTMTQPGGIAYDSERVQGGENNNVFDIYVEKIKDIDVQIKLVEAEIIILSINLKDMENSLRQMKDPLIKIFVMSYIDGLSVKDICERTNYGKSEIYRKLKIIRKILKWGKNGKEYMI